MHGLPWHTSGSTVIRLLMIYLLHFGNCAWRASYTSFFNNNWETIIGDHGFLFHVQAAIFNSTFFPALVASVISMSRLGLKGSGSNCFSESRRQLHPGGIRGRCKRCRWIW